MSLQNDVEALANSIDLELYDTSIVTEHDETIYRVSVISKELDENNKHKSVTLEKCVELSHLLSPLLDVTSPVSGEYRLEVGSPGIERKLTKLDNFKKSIGENVAIVTSDKEKYRAVLQAVEGSDIILKNEDETVNVDFNSITKAKTYFEW
jgi:ribosome maturation factor RimP